ncbi:MAG: protein kinase [Gemmatimonadetes bacterium]|nr:protein kinase [Gemmatimonadota bacterium]
MALPSHPNLKAALADRYAIERELGAGGTATVYLAQDIKHERQVAVKVLRPELAATLGSERFLREIKIAANLHHPHILPLYDSGDAEGFLYYVMPYVEGESLRDRLNREKQLPLDDALQIAREVADALGSAHSHDVVHRDIKPENILLEEGHAVVADFGIARAVTAAGGGKLTETGLAIGTPSYMSPEQAAGSEELDGRTDVYSLGCVLYEMLGGQPPFTGPTVESIVHQHLAVDPPSITNLRPAVPAEIAGTLARALAKTPADRFSSAAQFAEALATRGGAAAATVAAAPVSDRARVRRAVAIGLGAVVLLVAALLVWRRAPSTTPLVSPTTIAVLPFTVRGSEDVAYLGEGMVDLLGTKLDGAGEWRSADPRAVLGVLAQEAGGVLDPERGRAVAEHVGAGLYVLGNILEVGGRLRVDASLYNPNLDAPLVAQATVEGKAAEIFDLVDDLATQLLTAQTGGPGARVTRIAAVTTSSLPALKAYLEGETAFRAGHYGSAVEAFQRAVAADSLFALAYYRLSVAAEWDARDALVQDAAQQAIRHAERLSEHDRLLLEAFIAWRRGAADEAEDLYRGIIGTHPDYVEAWFQLSEVLFHYNPLRGRSLAESREALERLLAFDPDHEPTLIHLARVAAHERNRAELDSLVRRILELNPEGDRALEMRVLRAFASDDRADQERLIGELRRASDFVLILATWHVALFTHNLPGAARLARVVADSTRAPKVQALGRVWLAHLELARGRWRAARAELAAAEPLDRASALEYRALFTALPFVPVSRAQVEDARDELERWDATSVPPSVTTTVLVSKHDGAHPHLRKYLLGLLSARLGDPVAATRHAAELEALGGPDRARALAGDLAGSIRAQVALIEGRPADALMALEQTRRQTFYQLTLSSPFYSQAYERYMQATLLEELGQTEEALRWYSSVVGTSPNELIYLAPSHLRRAEIYERLGQPEKAAEHYARFVELWADCDPELRPVVDDAKERIARLAGEPAGER